jgi:hypothetical protein
MMLLPDLCRIGDGPSRVVDEDGAVVLARCRVTRTARDRLVGLLGTSALGAGEGLWIAPCRGVHTAFMRMPIACALLDSDGRVLAVADPLPAWRSLSARGARAAVECAPGGLAGVRSWARLALLPGDSGDRIVTPGG